MPVSISSHQGVSAVATAESVLILDAEGKKLGQQDKLGFSPKSVSLDATGKKVFVGGDDNKVHVYEIQGSELKTVRDMGSHLGYISALAAHPTLNLLAVGDSVGKIFLYDTETGEVVLQSWVFHSGRITGLQWSPCGIFLVSGSIDTNVYVWNREKKFQKVAIKNAHVDAVNDVGFLNKSSDSAKINVVSVGQDAAVRVWEVTKPQ